MSYKDVPSAWVFEYYCNLPYSLNTDLVKIKSLWNNEKTPSMVIRYINGGYIFKDFSSGKSGNHVTLVKELYNISINEALYKILIDYSEYVINNGLPAITREIKSEKRYKFSHYELRNWNVQDGKFWTSFGISSKILEQYNVKPLSKVVLSKTDNPDVELTPTFCYGYFTNQGELYRVYQPYSKQKFVILNADYIQGLNQLKFKSDYVIICSSLKDIMSFVATAINADLLAPNSENSLLDESVITWLKSRYKHVIILFDNDKAGKDAANKYSIYDISSINLDLKKDLSDSIKAFGIEKVREELLIELRKYKNENLSS